jgi:GTP-binding protein
MFLDEVKIEVRSGRGGDGAVHFRREKYVPRGGPDGGNGGKGGDVILFVDKRRNTLSSFRRSRNFRAEDGRPGGVSDKTGRSGKDVLVPVPPGTVVRDQETGLLMGDLIEPDQRLIVSKGGRGGRGNARFATARNQSPRMAEKGEPGEERVLELELRLLADVGIIGVPNAGKSTFLAAVTNAQPKIAAYPFTTLHPNLGVASLDDEVEVVLADIPGLIEGAHAGAGLGSTFLRHIQRTRVLIHLLDGAADDPWADYSQINSELSLFDPKLGQKAQVIAINKIDLPQVRDRVDTIVEYFKQEGLEVHLVSALARQGLRELLYEAIRLLALVKDDQEELELPVYRLDTNPEDFEIKREDDGAWRVSGVAVERAAAMTYWEHDEAVRRFQRILEHLGVEDALQEAGIQTGDTVRIGEYELEWVI